MVRWWPLINFLNYSKVYNNLSICINDFIRLNVRPLSDDEQRLNVPKVISCNEHKREVTVLQNVANKLIDRVFTFDKVCFYLHYDLLTGLCVFYRWFLFLNIHFLCCFLSYPRFLGPKHSKGLYSSRQFRQLLMKSLRDSTALSLHMGRQALEKHIQWRVGWGTRYRLVI